MRLLALGAAIAIAMAGFPLSGAAAAAAPTSGVCPTDPLAPARTPVVALDTRPGPGGLPAAYGGMQYRRSTGLGPKQIALTFDDGPDPEVTPRVLRVLERHCLKATFFMVGWYAKAHPDLVRAVAADGHVIGAHTWMHPDNIRRLTPAAGEAEIAEGFDGIREALDGGPPAEQAQLAPFFRFPGLNDSPALISWLAARDVAVVSADLGTDDWRGIGPGAIEWRTLRYVAHTGGGIMVMHDTKPATAEALSDLITELEARGYTFVQLVPAAGARDRAEAVPASLLHPVQPAARAVAASAGSFDAVDAWIRTSIRDVQDGARQLVADVGDWRK